MPKVTVQVINQSGEQLAVTEQTQVENQQARESVISIVVDSMRPGGQVNRAVNANFNGITRRAS